ncbi:unnamed protein product [Closterium sp. NIES-53]
MVDGAKGPRGAARSVGVDGPTAATAASAATAATAAPTATAAMASPIVLTFDAEGRSRFRPPHSKMGLLSAALACLVSPCRRPHLLGDASVLRVWGSRAFVRDTSADKLSSCAVPCVFLGLPPDAPGWQFYHATSRCVLSSQDVTFDESVSYYHPVEPVEVAVESGAARGAEPAGAGPGGAVLAVAESEGAEPGGTEPERVEPGGAEPGGAEPWGAELEHDESGGPPGVPRAAGATGPAAGGASRAGIAGVAATDAGGAGAVGGPTGVRAAGGAGAAGPGGARTGGTGAAGAGGSAGVGAVGAGAVATGGAAGARAAGGTGASGAAGVVAGDPGAEGTGAVSAVSRSAARPYYVPHLQQVLGLSPSTGPTPPLLSPPPVQSELQLQPASPLTGPSPYCGLTRGLMERREPESRPALPESRPASLESRPESPVHAARTGRRFPRQRPPPVPGTHSMTLCPSTAPQRVPLPSPSASSLPDGPDPESDYLRAASPTITRFLATAVTDPSFESTAASALVVELVDFAAAYRLDYTTSLVAESESASVCPPSVGGECALGTDVLEDRQEEFECFATTLPHLVSMLLAYKGDPDAPDIPTPRSYAEAKEGPYSSQWLAAMDAEMASWKSTGTYVDEVPPCGANIVSGMWIFRGSLNEEIWLRRPPGFTGSFPAGTQWSLRRPVYRLRQAPREWHDTLRTTLAALGFAPSTADPSLFLRTNTTLPLFYVLVYVDDLVFATADTEALAHMKLELAQRTITLTQSHMVQQILQRFGFTYSSPQSTPLPTGHLLSAPPSDESVELSGPYPELVGCLMYLMTCTRPDLAYPLSILARYVAPVRRAWGSCLEDGLNLSSLVTQMLPGSSCEAEIYTGAMAAQELRWLTYLLTDLGEVPRSPPVLYVDNKAMLALC